VTGGRHHLYLSSRQTSLTLYQVGVGQVGGVDLHVSYGLSLLLSCLLFEFCCCLVFKTSENICAEQFLFFGKYDTSLNSHHSFLVHAICKN